MSKVVIADSTCLIGLSKIGRLDVLRQLFGTVLIPSAVFHEQEQAAEFVILDDWKARQMALAVALPVIGTVAVLTKAADKGIIQELQSILEDLRKVGFRFPLP